MRGLDPGSRRGWTSTPRSLESCLKLRTCLHDCTDSTDCFLTCLDFDLSSRNSQDSTGLEPSPAKRARLNPTVDPVLTLVAYKDLPQPVVMEVPLVSLKGKNVKVLLSIRPNDQIYLANTGNAEVLTCWVLTEVRVTGLSFQCACPI